MKSQKNFFNRVLSKIFVKLFGHTIDQMVKQEVEKKSQNLIDEIRKTNEEVSKIKDQLTPAKVKKVHDPSLHEFEAKGLSIRVNKTNYPDQLTFFTSKPCWKNGKAEFQSAYPFELITELYNSYDKNGIQERHICEQKYWLDCKNGEESLKFLTAFKDLPISEIKTASSFEFNITKSGAVAWDKILPSVLHTIANLFPDIEKTEKPASASSEVEHL